MLLFKIPSAVESVNVEVVYEKKKKSLTKRKSKVAPDPFLEAGLGNEKYFVAHWDENFEASEG